MGYTKTFLFLAALTALFGGVGFAVGGEAGIVIALLIAGAMNVFAWYSSDSLALRAYRAQPADPRIHADYLSIIEQLAQRADLPVPRAYVLPGEQPNAFATGRNPNHSAVAATEGLLRTLSNEELAGVMAHELAHIKNRDTLLSTVTATLAGALTMIAHWGFFFSGSRDNDRGGVGALAGLAIMILAPIAAALVQFAISRTREYAADRLGGEICGNPLWLASALEKLSRAAKRCHNPRAEAHPATAHLFIVNPLAGLRMGKLFATHPDTRIRIKYLHEQAAEGASLPPLVLGTTQRSPIERSRPTHDGYGGPWG